MKITKQTIRDFYEEFFNQQDSSNLINIIHENYIQHNPNVEQGRQGLIKAFKCKFNSDEYFKLEIDNIVLDSDYAAVFLRSVDSTGIAKAHVVDLYRIENDMFVEHWDYFDRGK